MVAVNHIAENGERSHAIDEHSLAEHRLAHIGDEDVGNNPDPGNNRDVNLGMPEEPEQVLPQQSRSARMWDQLIVQNQSRGNEEARSRNVIQNHQDTSGH